MSLRETIEGARREAAQNIKPLDRSGKGRSKRAAATAPTTQVVGNKPNAGFTKRSVSRAKPSREAAGNIRVVSSDDYRSGNTKKTEDMTRSEKKAVRKKQRSAEDRRASVSRSILEGHSSYARSQHIWWILVGAGLAMTMVSWSIGTVYGSDESTNFYKILTVGLLVVAYALIIIAFIYDWRVVRPMRKAADEEVARMSDKRVKQYLVTQAEEERREQAARAKAKTPRKKLFARREQHK